MAVTLKDIARECGLAVSTVSNILNNHHTSFASEEARSRVKQTAERLGYKRDYLSSSLRTRKTQSVGLILDQIDERTRQDFLVPFVERFSDQGYEVALAEHRYDPDRAAAALDGFGDRCKDGVVLFTDLLGKPPEAQDRLLRSLKASALKVLGIGSRFRGLVPSLDIDRGWAVERSLNHFFRQGHREVHVVYEYDWDMRPHFDLWDHPGVTFWGGVHHPEDFLRRLEAQGLGAATAMFFRTDRIAIGAMTALRDRGYRVPEDVEVISFDNFPFTEHTVPALSTWDIGFHRLGHRSQEFLAAWMAGAAPDPTTYELFQPDFVSRKSHKGEL